MSIESVPTPVMADSLRPVPISSDAFRHGMRRLVSGVCILTSEFEGKAAGLTATAVTSLSVDPPRLLACVNEKASAFPVIEKSHVLCVNVLAADEVAYAK